MHLSIVVVVVVAPINYRTRCLRVFQARMAWGFKRGTRRPRAARPASGNPRNGHKAVLGVACPQGVEGSGRAGPGETLGSPWTPIAIRARVFGGGNRYRHTSISGLRYSIPYLSRKVMKLGWR
jgi:hypothetical protein